MNAQRYQGSLGIGYAALAGLVAGLVMAMIAMIATLTMGMGAMAMPDMIGGLILGPGVSMTGGALVTFVGLLLHMMLSALFGVLYAVIVKHVTHEFLFTAIAYGLALWIVNFYVVGNILPNAGAFAQHDPLFLAVLTHLAYGVTLGLGALGVRAVSSVFR